MISSIVIVSELVLVGLLCLLSVRVLTYSRTHSFTLSPGLSQPGKAGDGQHTVVSRYHPDEFRGSDLVGDNTKSELTAKLHILLSLQETHVREQRLNLSTSPKGIKDYTIAWLYGAACGLTNQPRFYTRQLTAVVAQLASTRLKLEEEDVREVLAGLTRCHTCLACFRSGLEGAEYWEEHKHVPDKNRLYTTMTSYAFI